MTPADIRRTGDPIAQEEARYSQDADGNLTDRVALIAMREGLEMAAAWHDEAARQCLMMDDTVMSNPWVAARQHIASAIEIRAMKDVVG